jgi:hypothetical protein
MEEKWQNTLGMVRVNSKKILNSLACNGIILLQPLKNKVVASGTGSDRRHSRRLRPDKDIFLWKDGRPDRKAHLLDISINGMYVETDAPLEEGQELQLSMHALLPLRYPAITGRVVRKAPKGMALQFV